MRFSRILVHLILGAGILVFYGHEVKDGIPSPHFMTLYGKWLGKICHILGLKIQLSFHETAATSTKSFVFVSNHISWLDIPALASQLNAGFLSKSEVIDWPVIGWLAQHSGTIFIHRGSHGAATRAIKDINHHLNNNHNVMIFPESTTTDGTELKHFHARLFASAIETDSPVLPVAISYFDEHGNLSKTIPYTGEQSLLKNFWVLIGIKTTLVNIVVLPAISDTRIKTRKEIAHEARNHILGVLSDNWKNER